MILRYLIDTNICIYIAKQAPLNVLRKFEQISVGMMAMSIVTHGELIYGAQKSHHPHKTLTVIEQLTQLIPSLPMSIEAAKHYGEIRHALAKEGKTIGNNDLWIAAHARSLNLVLVTNNEKEFMRVPNLQVENWVN